MQKSVVIGIGGGSGSGKTTLTEGLSQAFPHNTAILHLDDYFIPESEMTQLAGESNWDDPSSIDQKRFVEEIQGLVNRPNPPELVVAEGFLILHFFEIRELLDIKIFLGGSYEAINQRRVHPMWDNYRENVLKPMYEQYVEPSSQYADINYDATRLTAEEILINTVQMIRTLIPED